MNIRNILLTFLIWLASAIAFGLIGVVELDWQKWDGLARHGVATAGRVENKEPENHNSIRYSYSVNGNHYSGPGSAGGENPSFDQLQIGDRVKVMYDSRDPAQSILGSAQSQARSINTGILFLTVLGPVSLIFALYRKGWLPNRAA